MNNIDRNESRGKVPKKKMIFFGNGRLAEYALGILSQNFEVIFHARTREDLEEVKRIKTESKEAIGVLASFGVMVKGDILSLFEPMGILNIHPSKLPEYRGASPIETAIIDGKTEFSVSIMKLVKDMDAGPIYYQETFPDLELKKDTIYKTLAEAGAKWISKNIDKLPESVEQEDKPSFTRKFEKSDGIISPKIETAEEINRKVIAFQDFPKSKIEIFGRECIILEAKVSELCSALHSELTEGEVVVSDDKKQIFLVCKDETILEIKKLQPAGKKPMEAQAFINGYFRQK